MSEQNHFIYTEEVIWRWAPVLIGSIKRWGWGAMPQKIQQELIESTEEWVWVLQILAGTLSSP